jgi:hypothetical protein
VDITNTTYNAICIIPGVLDFFVASIVSLFGIRSRGIVSAGQKKRGTHERREKPPYIFQHKHSKINPS